jgi:hypothetical protein
MLIWQRTKDEGRKPDTLLVGSGQYEEIKSIAELLTKHFNYVLGDAEIFMGLQVIQVKATDYLQVFSQAKLQKQGVYNE